MKHYSLEKWVDFARNVIGKKERVAMQSHLEDGCKQCSTTLRLWQRVDEVARHKHNCEPPESFVRSIKGTFAIRGPRRTSPGTRAVAELLFDSFRNPLLAGVRSTTTAARQLLYRVGSYRIDVRIEPRGDCDKVEVTGQILDSADPSEGVGAAEVSLMKGNKVLAGSVTDRFGEFNLECEMGNIFNLSVILPTEQIRLPLIDPASGVDESKSLSSDASRKKGTSNRL
jgi:hypothetical protein